MRRQPVLLSTLVIVLFTIATSVAASATNLDPAVFFTANWPSTDTAPATVLEQALLDRLNAATTSIDAALYDFSRPSLQDVLIAAKNRGVVVRVVTDDEARATTTSKPFYDALTSAGIPVSDDQGITRLTHNKCTIVNRQLVRIGSANCSHSDVTENHNNAASFASAELAQA